MERSMSTRWPIISHKKDSQPSYAQFLHSRPGYAVLAQPLLSLNAPVYRPIYAVFGGQFMPRVTRVSNLQVKKICADGSTQLSHADSFHNNRSFFSRKDVCRISIHSLVSS